MWRVLGRRWGGQPLGMVDGFGVVGDRPMGVEVGEGEREVY